MTYPVIDLTGRVLDSLTVLGQAGRTPDGKKILWECQCSCGNLVILQGISIRNRYRKHHSCGCQHGKWNQTHGHTSTEGFHPLYNRWSKIKSRCLYLLDKDYQNYGGRGITLCTRWHSFENFLKDMGPSYKPGLTLDRINNNKGYSPKNCRWSTVKEQSNNTRFNIQIKTPKGKMTVAQAAKEYNIKPVTIYARIKRGWAEKDLLKSTT